MVHLKFVFEFHEEYLASKAEKKVRQLVEDTLPKPKTKIMHEVKKKTSFEKFSIK